MLLTATLGAPVLGAIHSLFWIVSVDGPDDASDAAMRIAAAVDTTNTWTGIRHAISRIKPLSDCARRAPTAPISQQGEPVQPRAALTWDISSQWASRDDNARDRAIWNGFKRLPRPLLGALDSCISGSLLEGWCSRYARAALDRELDTHKRELGEEYASSFRRYDAELCALTRLAAKVEER